MKKWFSLMAAFSAALIVTGQESKDSANMAQPEFVNFIYGYKSSENKMITLEKGVVDLKTKMKAAGFGGSTSAYVLQGEKSPIRFSPAENKEFSVKMANVGMGGGGMDPGNMIKLHKFEIKDGNRQSILQKTSFMGTGAQVNQDGISFNVKEKSNGVYLLVPEKPLGPGEYGFINMMLPAAGNSSKGGMSYTVFAFGIDK
jgi:hypothetical protein